MTDQVVDRKTGSNAPKRDCPRILLAEDDSEMRAMLRWNLQREGYNVEESSTGVELMDRLLCGESRDELSRFDLLISDIRLPGITGLEIIEGLHEKASFPPFILITAFGDEETHKEAERLGAIAVFDKPFEIDDLVVTVRKELERSSL